MGSGTDGPSGLDSTSSLELALDRAIAARYAGVDDRGGKKRRNTPVQNFAVVTARSDEQAHTPTEDLHARTPTENLHGRASTALAVARPGESSLMLPARLRWKDIEVTDEFQAYAARVARGEKLEPYRGAVLSRPCAEFPWSMPREHQMLPPDRASLLPPRPSFPPMSMSIAPPAPASGAAVYPERGRALKTALWLAGAVSSIVGALGVGAGATNASGNEFDEHAPDPRKLTPSPAAAPSEALASSLDDAALRRAALDGRPLDTLAPPSAPASVRPNPSVTPSPASAISARTPSPFTATIAPRSAPARVVPVSPSPTIAVTAPVSTTTPAPASAPTSSRLTIPPPGPVPAAGEVARGVVTTARPDAASSAEGSLFSDRPSF